MQAAKFYAVKYRNGTTKIFEGEWDRVCFKVLYRKGVVYRGFNTKAEAREWLAVPTIPFRTANTPHRKNTHYLYVDGSFSQKTGRSGWGWALIRNRNVIKEDFGSCDNSTGSRNIVGEVYATIKGAEYCVNNNVSPVIVVHDYAGIGLWALGQWKARKPVAKDYTEVIQQYMEQIEVRFEKVNGHSGIHWNDYVDELTRMYMSTGR